MILGILHKGSGIGDQLFSYIATRVRAADLGVDFGFVGKEFFKGASFMNLDWGIDPNTSGRTFGYHIEEPSGKLVFDWEPNKVLIHELNKPYFDPEFKFISDGSVIDGYGAQDIRYFEHRLDEIREWLRTEHLFIHPDTCIINFRGGEYRAISDLFLPREYWDKAVKTMKEKNSRIEFEVHTDDPITAREFFPQFKIIDNRMITQDKQYENISLNWRSIRYARNVIISNSGFPIIPLLLNKEVNVIAPHYWAGRNVGEWRRPGNYYSKFQYV
jgi:hypothetical protein